MATCLAFALTAPMALVTRGAVPTTPRVVVAGTAHPAIIRALFSAISQTEKPTAKGQPATDKSPTKDSKPAPNADDRKRFQPYGYVTHEHEVMISGRALDEEGEPVAGARVIVVPVAPMGVPYGNRTALAEGKSGADGRFRFDKVPFTVLEFAPQAVPKASEALFQVFAVAEGHGYVWRHTKSYRPERRPADTDSPKPDDDKKSDTKPDANRAPKNDDLQHVFFDGEPIVLDLEFSPEVRLHGTITDDLGNPLKNAVVQVGLVNSSRDLPGTPPRGWSARYLENSPRGADGQFNGFSALPEEFRLARTDDEGRYEIRGLPRDCSLLTHLDYLTEFDPAGESIQTGKAPVPGGRFVG
jgi:hypothetical protein